MAANVDLHWVLLLVMFFSSGFCTNYNCLDQSNCLEDSQATYVEIDNQVFCCLGGFAVSFSVQVPGLDFTSVGAISEDMSFVNNSFSRSEVAPIAARGDSSSSSDEDDVLECSCKEMDDNGNLME